MPRSPWPEKSDSVCLHHSYVQADYISNLSSGAIPWYMWMIYTWLSNHVHYTNGGKLFIHFQTLTVQPSKFGNGKVSSSHTLPSMWLLFDAWIKLNLIHMIIWTPLSLLVCFVLSFAQICYDNKENMMIWVPIVIPTTQQFTLESQYEWRYNRQQTERTRFKMYPFKLYSHVSLWV